MSSSIQTYALRKNNTGTTLELTERYLAPLGPHEVLVQVGAASLNYRDLLVYKGKASEIKDGLIPISDVAGVVIKAGDAVTQWKIGDRVATAFFPAWKDGTFKKEYLASSVGAGQLDGYLSEQIKISEDSLVRIPAHLSLAEASALSCAGVTAWHALVDLGNVKDGETVLIIGTGGVALMALQLAASLGAKPIILSSSDEKLEHAFMLGAWKGINYTKTPDWENEVLKITNGAGVRHILELGGPATFDKSIASIAAGGIIYQIGVLTGFDLRPNLLPLQFANASIQGICVGSIRHFNELNAFLSKMQIKPFIGSTFGLKEVKQAYDYMAAGMHTGKITILLDDTLTMKNASMYLQR
jgi:NADPH:quinone reductase-like Zn-dependent oxidoreductase